MTIYNWLSLFGIPAIMGTIMKILIDSLKKTKEMQESETESIKAGLQALLRAQMISEYDKWLERGFAPIYAKENFENCWARYHNLGANGVMDDLHEKFLNLPTTEKGEN